MPEFPNISSCSSRSGFPCSLWFGLILTWVFPPLASAFPTIGTANLPLNPPDATVNRLDLGLSAVGTVQADLGFGPTNININASDSETSSISGSLICDFELDFNPDTLAVDARTISFRQSPVAIDEDPSFNLNLGSYLFFPIGSVAVNGLNLAGTPDTPGAPGNVTEPSFPLSSHEFRLYQGTIAGTASGLAADYIDPIDIDLAVTPLVGPLGADNGSVTISPPTQTGSLVSYSVNVTIPVDFSSLVLDDPVNVTVTAQGTVSATGSLTVDLDADSDGDGLKDVDELAGTSGYVTDPSLRDTDKDGVADGTEIADGSNPTDRNDFILPTITGELISYYNFDEGSGTTAADTAALGTAENATTRTGTIAWAAPLIGTSSLDLPGNADMSVADAIGKLPSPNAFTLMAWVNPDSYNLAGNYNGIFMTRPENWGLAINNSGVTTQAYDYRFDNAPDGSGGSVGLDSSPGSAPVGDWQHVAMSWQGDGSTFTGKIYLDGLLVQTIDEVSHADVSRVYTAAGQTWFIGNDNDRRFDGQVDDLCVFGTALSDEDVIAIADAGRAGIPVTELLPSAPIKIIDILSHSPAEDDITIIWDSNGGAATYKVLSTLDLSTPIGSWTIERVSVSNGGSTTGFTDTGVLATEAKKFYVIQKNQD